MPRSVPPFLRERHMNHEETGASWYNEVVGSFMRLVRVSANFTIVPPEAHEQGADEVAPYVVARSQDDHRHWVFHAAEDAWYEGAIINPDFDLVLASGENNPYEPQHSKDASTLPAPPTTPPADTPRKSAWDRIKES